MTRAEALKAEQIINDCLRYRHIWGYPYPRTPDSCRGCVYSYDPALYDPGCRHPQGVLPRNQRKAEAQASPRNAGRRAGPQLRGEDT